MATLSLNGAGHIARKTLFQNLTLTLGPRDCLGLVAQNGTGKSTLLRCLSGELELSHGEIMTSRGARVGLVPQEVPPILLGHTLQNAVLAALPEGQRASEAWRADMVLDSLETPRALRSLDVAALSGGWRRLMLLARVWVGEPDALLLDEPTNYLDLEKILLLERRLDARPSGLPVVVASHDRAFLDAATNRTLFLRPEISRLFPLPYSRARAVLAEADTADATAQARDLKESQQLRRQSAKLKNIGINSHSGCASGPRRSRRRSCNSTRSGLG
jgi:ATPase subunit of ABC transporter with duplicated ATPase domains